MQLAWAQLPLVFDGGGRPVNAAVSWWRLGMSGWTGRTAMPGSRCTRA